VVAAVGAGVERFRVGDRVAVFHHIPCMDCFYCARKLYAQCEGYRKVGVTAGFEPAGGGFAQYVRVMDWIVERGVEKIPDGVPFERAALLEPFHTVHKAVVLADPQPGETVVILGQGPIGLMFTMLVARAGARILATDTIALRRSLSGEFGAGVVLDPRTDDVVGRAVGMSEGRGADLVIVAASAPGIVEQAIRCSRPGSRILLFAQTSDREIVEVSGAAICKEERTLFGCYSASVDVQSESAALVFGGEMPVERLISDCVPLDEIRAGIDLALRPNAQSLKIVVQPQRWSK
jgi:L-iditol 2-dehydrogenase